MYTDDNKQGGVYKDNAFVQSMDYNASFIHSKEQLAKTKPKRLSQTDQRLPPGQVVTEKFPVLDLGVKPHFDPKTWRLQVSGLVEHEQVFTYDDIRQMPATQMHADFHCVTSWSKYDVQWTGVLFKDFLKIIKPTFSWKFLIQESMDGYTTNVPREDLEKANVLLAYELDGNPIPREHGWPVRLIIPHLYAWKGAKFLKALKFSDKDGPGFWEVRGYHNRGNVWKEERYSRV